MWNKAFVVTAGVAVGVSLSFVAIGAQEVVLPETDVSGTYAIREHPQEPQFGRPLGCVEIIVPSGAGLENGGYFQARGAKEGIPVMPSLNDPSSASDFGRRHAYEQSPKTPPGQVGKVCNR